jgi:hypothetical protein
MYVVNPLGSSTLDKRLAPVYIDFNSTKNSKFTRQNLGFNQVENLNSLICILYRLLQSASTIGCEA